MACHWTASWAGWMRFWATDPVKDAPIHGSGGGLGVSLKVSSNPNHPIIPIATTTFSQFFFFPFVLFPQRLQCERHACASEWNNLDEMFKLELFWIWELSRSVELLLHFFQAHKMSSPKSKSSSHIFLWTPIFLQFIELFCALLNSSIAITLLLTGNAVRGKKPTK